MGDRPGRVEAFQQERQRLHDLMMQRGTDLQKRFLALDNRAYFDGELPAKTKELLGLVASTVLRCDDCILYHLVRCRELGYSNAELTEALMVAQVVGGTITVPHVRRAFAALEEMDGNRESS